MHQLLLQVGINEKDEDDEGQGETDVVDNDSEDEDDDKTVIPFRISQINNENLNGEIIQNQ